MERAVECGEGLALLGTARAGPIGLAVPGLAMASRSPAASAPIAGSLRLEAGPPAPEGRRGVVLISGEERLALEFTIPTPEVSGSPGSAEAAGDGTWLVHAPLQGEAAARLLAARPGLVVLGNARTLLLEGAPFVRAVRDLRALLGAGPVLWAPRVALPHRVALLVYLGVDLLDTTEADLRAASGEYLDPTLGPVDAASLQREGGCSCPSCAGPSAPDLEVHADWHLRRELALARAAIREGRLRELVESRLTAEPLLAEMLRYADADLAGPLEARMPVTGGAVRPYVLKESQRRPEVRRFRARLIERYRVPPSKRVLLLVPCSRTKPYRNSRSHRRFSRALEGLPHLERVHWVSVTSPLGLVPRELEDTFPARHYDIPVTGEWDEAERSAVVEALSALRRGAPYLRTVVHLDPAEYGFLREAAGEARWTLADDRTTTSEALARLRSGVSEALEGLDAPPGGPLSTVREELEAIAAFQFGRAAAARLFSPPVRLAGRPWFQRVTDGHGTDLATWREPRGLFHLTVAGAARMLPEHPLEVEVDPKVDLLGDLFTPGVVRADPGIRTGDAVLLVRDGRLLGVGEAELPGPLMTELPRGLAVHVRHRTRAEDPATATGPTPT